MKKSTKTKKTTAATQKSDLIDEDETFPGSPPVQQKYPPGTLPVELDYLPGERRRIVAKPMKLRRRR